MDRSKPTRTEHLHRHEQAQFETVIVIRQNWNRLSDQAEKQNKREELSSTQTMGRQVQLLFRAISTRKDARALIDCQSQID